MAHWRLCFFIGHITRLMMLVFMALTLSGCLATFTGKNGHKYVKVRKGDTVWLLARRTGVSMKQIMRLNRLRAPYKLRIGQSLCIKKNLDGYHQTLKSSKTPVRRSDKRRRYTKRPLKHARATKKVIASQKSSRRTLKSSRRTPKKRQSTYTKTASTKTYAIPTKYFSWPLKGTIIRSFGKSTLGQLNDGINIKGPSGGSVKAAGAGKIIYAGSKVAGYGNLLLIQHDKDWVSTYCHLGTLSVNKGQWVKAGQIIGTVGQTGSVKGSQLHFEIRYKRKPIDPKPHLR
jgi:murein DD-endopeptidase MepM/ murein hydrolase activator NlpD